MKKNLSICWVMLALLTIPMLGGCNRDDDVKTIFTGKVWKLSYIFREGDPKAYVNFWYDDREAEANSIIIQKTDGNYEIEFTGANIDGEFSGSISGKVVDAIFSGTWRANAETRAMSTSDMKWTSDETDILAKQFQKGLNSRILFSDAHQHSTALHPHKYFQSPQLLFGPVLPLLPATHSSAERPYINLPAGFSMAPALSLR